MNEPERVEPLLPLEGPPAHVWSAVLAAAVSADPVRADELAVLLPEPPAGQLEPLEGEPGWAPDVDLGPTHVDDSRGSAPESWDAAPESHGLHDGQGLESGPDLPDGDDAGWGIP